MINFSSIGGVVGLAGSGIYSASKFAIEVLSESLSHELEPFGIHVTIVETGYFKTDFLDPSSGRYGSRKVDDYRANPSSGRSSFASATTTSPAIPRSSARRSCACREPTSHPSASSQEAMP